jgi:hypothetical protein
MYGGVKTKHRGNEVVQNRTIKIEEAYALLNTDSSLPIHSIQAKMK